MRTTEYRQVAVLWERVCRRRVHFLPGECALVCEIRFYRLSQMWSAINENCNRKESHLFWSFCVP